MRLEILPGNDEDATHLIGRLRNRDLEELRAYGSDSPDNQLMESWNNTRLRWTVWIDGSVACVFGCRGINDIGVPWLLGSDFTKKMRRVFIAESKKYIDVMRKRYNTLFNYVYYKNRQSIKWLIWLGFTVDRPKPYGEFGNPFHLFYSCATRQL